MNPLNAMALTLAVCSGFATFAFMQFGGGLSHWAAFVAWASFFHAGGAKLFSFSITDNTMINVSLSMLIGIGFGILTTRLAGLLSKSPSDATA